MEAGGTARSSSRARVATAAASALALALLLATASGGPGAGADRAAAASSAGGEASCAYAEAERLLVARGAALRFVRRGPVLAVIDAERGARVPCAGEPARIDGLERVRFRATRAIYQSAVIDLRGGRLGTRAGRVAFRLQFSNRTNGDEGASANVIGTRGRDAISVGRVAGRPAIDLGAGSSPAADVRIVVRPKPPRRDAPDIVIEGGRGSDAIGAVRRGGFDGALRPAMASLDLRGGRGADVLAGGPGEDSLRGGPGRDLLVGTGGNDTLFGGPGGDSLAAGAGNDEIRAADSHAEAVLCGAGERDRAIIDTRDRAERCERMTVRPARRH